MSGSNCFEGAENAWYSSVTIKYSPEETYDDKTRWSAIQKASFNLHPNVKERVVPIALGLAKVPWNEPSK